MDNTGTNLTQNTNYNKLVSDIGTLLNNGRKQMAIAINTSMVHTYWSIGKHIVEFEQKGNERAEYGSNLINRLSRDLTERYGKGFGKSNLLYIRKFYLTFPKSGTVSHLLTWSHFYEILKKDDPMEISFYVKQCEIEGWSVRELKRQMQSMLFHRLALSKDKEQVLKLSHEGQQVQKPEDILRDPYVFDFVGLPETYNYTEKDLEDGLLKQFEMFLLELGR